MKEFGDGVKEERENDGRKEGKKREGKEGREGLRKRKKEGD